MRKPGQNNKFSPKKWIKPGMLRCTTFQYYIPAIFLKFCTPAILEHLWCLPFGTTIIRNITWRMVFLTWIKPGHNLEFYG